MSAFGQRRKARVINVSADDGDDDDNSVGASYLEPTIKFSSKGSRKPFRQSTLRKSVNLHEHSSDPATTPSTGGGREVKKGVAIINNDDDDTGPVVVRPGMIRAGSSRKNLKKKPSGLSFNGAGEDEDSLGAPKKVSFGKRVLENNALKKSMAMRSLPTRDLPEDDSSHPRYSKEYLDELQSSTPNTPQNISDLHLDEADRLMFDSSELEGALIMNEAELDVEAKSKEPSPIPTTTILTDAEVRERKERRARMALEGGEDDYISFEDSDGDWRASRKTKERESRLVAEDEDLGEGFDEFVDDGGVALGKSASREAKRRQRREIADMIQQAEGNSGESSDESEAERRAAYEAAQARAGMDGLRREKKRQAASASKPKPGASAAALMPAKITPLPDLGVCLARLRQRVEGMGKELQARETRIAELERDKDTIVARQEDVQRQLEEAGKKYSAAAATIGGASGGNGLGEVDVMDIDSLAGKPNAQFAGHRGLESLGSVDRTDDDRVD